VALFRVLNKDGILVMPFFYGFGFMLVSITSTKENVGNQQHNQFRFTSGLASG
jgi:hypothetical protein